jgi:Protein of unknown function (DUF1566)
MNETIGTLSIKGKLRVKGGKYQKGRFTLVANSLQFEAPDSQITIDLKSVSMVQWQSSMVITNPDGVFEIRPLAESFKWNPIRAFQKELLTRCGTNRLNAFFGLSVKTPPIVPNTILVIIFIVFSYVAIQFMWPESKKAEPSPPPKAAASELKPKITPAPQPPNIWTDQKSGLTWQMRRTGGQMRWAQARAYCDKLSQDGFNDWRLPTISELRSLIRGCRKTETGGACRVTDSCLKRACKNDPCYGCEQPGPGVEGAYWPAELAGESKPDWSWSSSFVGGNRGVAWNVGFPEGSVNTNGVDGTGNDVRCVRSDKPTAATKQVKAESKPLPYKVEYFVNEDMGVKWQCEARVRISKKPNWDEANLSARKAFKDLCAGAPRGGNKPSLVFIWLYPPGADWQTDGAAWSAMVSATLHNSPAPRVTVSTTQIND